MTRALSTGQSHSNWNIARPSTVCRSMKRSLQPLVIAVGLTLAAVFFVVGVALARLFFAPDMEPVAAEPADAAAAAVVPTFTPTTEPFVLATPTPAATATPLPTSTPAVVVPPATALSNIRHEWQTWNNCGPATLAMNLSYYGSALDQAQIGAVLRNVPDDKNVGPQEMADFARGQGYNAEVRVNGSPDRLRALIAAGIPVLVETWHEAEPNDGLGHYRLLTGYDDARNVWIAYDTYDNRSPVAIDGTYQGVTLDYAEFDNWWRVFNRTFVLIYPPDRAAQVDAILGGPFDPNAMWRIALTAALATAAATPDDPIAWFNLGSSAVGAGDFTQAADAFDRARTLGLPWRMFWYQFGAFEAYWRTGRYEDVIALADATLAGGAAIEEVHYWRGMALASLGRQDEARAAWQTALQLNPDFQPAAQALAG